MLYNSRKVFMHSHKASVAGRYLKNLTSNLYVPLFTLATLAVFG